MFCCKWNIALCLLIARLISALEHSHGHGLHRRMSSHRKFPGSCSLHGSIGQADVPCMHYKITVFVLSLRTVLKHQ